MLSICTTLTDWRQLAQGSDLKMKTGHSPPLATSLSAPRKGIVSFQLNSDFPSDKTNRRGRRRSYRYESSDRRSPKLHCEMKFLLA